MTQQESKFIMWETLQDDPVSSTNKWHKKKVCFSKSCCKLLKI